MRLKPTKQEQALMLEASLLRTDLQLAREHIATLESHVETLTKALTTSHACATLRSDGTCEGCPVSDALAAVRK